MWLSHLLQITSLMVLNGNLLCKTHHSPLLNLLLERLLCSNTLTLCFRYIKTCEDLTLVNQVTSIPWDINL